MMRLHLASRSPRRRELLEAAGIPFDLVETPVDETPPAGISPEDLVVLLAARKAAAAAATLGEGWILGADTVVALGDRILGKPGDRSEAAAMLTALSGRTHRVITGLTLQDASTGRVLSDYDVTRVTMRTLNQEEILAYLATGEADDKAGAYAIQGAAGAFVTEVVGSWSNVVGLPMDLLARMIEETGIRE